MSSQKNKSAVVLLSGGMDSTVCAARAIADGFAVAALHVNYGQRTQSRELQAFNDVCDFYDIAQRLVVDISHLAAIGGSALTDDSISVPTTHADSHASSHADSEPPNKRNPETRIPVTYVPFRNANILAIATSWAEVLGAEALYIGAVEEDSSGYPDCRGTFFEAYEKMIDLGTRPETKIHIRTPLIHLRKADIVNTGLDLQAPLHLSWSCYSNSDVACGKCDSCALRLRGFREAGHTDPIAYSTSEG